MTAKSFSDLRVWQEARKLVLLVYKTTAKFPRSEMFGLTMQMRRAAVSVISNIAEGFARQSIREKIQFYHISLGSNAELETQMIISLGLKFSSKSEFDEIVGQIVAVNKMLNSLVKKLKLNAS